MRLKHLNASRTQTVSLQIVFLLLLGPSKASEEDNSVFYSRPARMENLVRLFSLAGKTAVVTGGTRGIGAAMAIALAEAGADIILVQVSRSVALGMRASL